MRLAHAMDALAAAPASPDRLFQSVLPWAIALVGLAVLGAILIVFVRRMTKSNDAFGPEGFTLQNLRDLREQGQLTEEEFQRARDAMVGRLSAAKQDRPPADKADADASDRAESSRRGEARSDDGEDASAGEKSAD